MLRLSDLRNGQGPGGALHAKPDLRRRSSSMRRCALPPRCSAPRRAPTRISANGPSRARSVDGSAVAEKTSVQVQMARAAADLDAAELLLRRTTLAQPRARGGDSVAACAHDPRLRPGVRNVGLDDRYVDDAERDGGLCQLAADPARLARHSLRRDAYRRQHRDQLQPFRPHRIRPAARSRTGRSF